MSRSRPSAAAAVVLTLVAAAGLTGCLGGPATNTPDNAADPSPAAAPAGAPVLRAHPGPDLVSVRAGALRLDDQPWVPRGVQLIGFDAPDGVRDGETSAARAHFGPGTLDGIVHFGADLVRVLVSQPAIDPESPLFSQAYLVDVQRAVDALRGRGLVVAVALQDLRRNGERFPRAGPNDASVRAWQHLAPLWQPDHGVIFELYDEPVDPDAGHVRQRMQKVVDAVRATGATNVVMVDGPALASSLTDPAIAVADPTAQVAYGVHPGGSGDADGWSRIFGGFATNHAVVVSEWNPSSAQAGCRNDWPVSAEGLLAYLRLHHVGVVGASFDQPGTILRGYSGAPTTYEHFTCGRPGSGAGELLRQQFSQS